MKSFRHSVPPHPKQLIVQGINLRWHDDRGDRCAELLDFNLTFRPHSSSLNIILTVVTRPLYSMAGLLDHLASKLVRTPIVSPEQIYIYKYNMSIFGLSTAFCPVATKLSEDFCDYK